MAKPKKDRSKTIPYGELERKRNNKEERVVREELPKILFSFKDFDRRQIPPGQLPDEWEEEKLLAYTLSKFGEVCNYNIVEAQQNKFLKIYGEFPEDSDFTHPTHIYEEARWAVIMNIKGQKGRIAGHIIDHVFYVVFLDRDHRFYKAKLKHT